MPSPEFSIQRLAAFALGETGGNPAGVVLCETLPEAAVMQAIAAEVGYSETVFAAPRRDEEGGGWRARYFAPEIEVPFCGHATIALGAALALHAGDGVFPLQLNEARITVEGRRTAQGLFATLQSPPTRSAPAAPERVEAALALFGYASADLDPRLPPAFAEGGARHLVLALRRRESLAAMQYDFAAGQAWMRAQKIVTVALIQAETPTRFHARNPFAAGGVYEDPATGAAAAALGGYLRDLGWPHEGEIEILQGEDMGVPSRIEASIPPQPGASIRISGRVRPISRLE